MNAIVAAIILVSVVFAVLETEATLRVANHHLFLAADLFFGGLFTIEYLLRIWVAGEDEKYRGFTGRLRFIVSPLALVDLLAILPFFITLGVTDAFLLRLFRLLRIFTLAKLGRYSVALQNIARAIKKRSYELLMSLFAAFTVMFLSATALYLTEGRIDPEHFGSIPRALWWGAATVSKVGYGGAFPVTVLGKVFAVVFAIAAVGVVALPTGILAAALGEAFRRDQIEPEIEVQRDND